MERLGAIEDLDTLRDLSGVVRYAAMVCRYVLSKATKLECRKTLPWRPRSSCIGMKSLLVAHSQRAYLRCDAESDPTDILQL